MHTIYSSIEQFALIIYCIELNVIKIVQFGFWLNIYFSKFIFQKKYQHKNHVKLSHNKSFRRSFWHTLTVQI